MNNRISSTLKAISVALFMASAAAHAAPSSGTLEAWQQAKYPLLFPSTITRHHTEQGSNIAAPGSVEAWQQAKFGWLNRGTHENVANANVASPGSYAAWLQAKYSINLAKR